MIKHLYDIFAERWLKPQGNAVWIYSDPHFGDLEAYRFKHLIKVPDKKDYFNRFKDGDVFETYETFVSKEVAKADAEQIKQINSKVGKHDTIIFLGDIGDVECIKKIRGYKVLIMGNHDKGASNYKANYVTTTIDDGNGHILYSSTYNENKLFDEVYEGPLMISDRVILSHEPIAVPEYMFNIHGHVHNKDYKGDSRHLNACAEAIDFTPIHLLKLIKNGLLKDIPDIHRPTIDNAVVRKNKRSRKN